MTNVSQANENSSHWRKSIYIMKQAVAEMGQAQQAGLKLLVAEYIGNKANHTISNGLKSDPIYV